jgi:hypothetical protein
MIASQAAIADEHGRFGIPALHDMSAADRGFLIGGV